MCTPQASHLVCLECAHVPLMLQQLQLTGTNQASRRATRKPPRSGIVPDTTLQQQQDRTRIVCPRPETRAMVNAQLALRVSQHTLQHSYPASDTAAFSDGSSEASTASHSAYLQHQPSSVVSSLAHGGCSHRPNELCSRSFGCCTRLSDLGCSLAAPGQHRGITHVKVSARRDDAPWDASTPVDERAVVPANVLDVLMESRQQRPTHSCILQCLYIPTHIRTHVSTNDSRACTRMHTNLSVFLAALACQHADRTQAALGGRDNLPSSSVE